MEGAPRCRFAEKSLDGPLHSQGERGHARVIEIDVVFNNGKLPPVFF
jgi:hypothetical protein